MPTRICVNHLGFHPQAEKRSVILLSERPSAESATFSVVDVGTSRKVYEASLQYQDDPFGQVAVATFSELTRPGLYQLRVGGRRSVPFFVRQDVYTRTAYDAFYYFHVQRCGQAESGQGIAWLDKEATGGPAPGLCWGGGPAGGRGGADRRRGPKRAAAMAPRG